MNHISRGTHAAQLLEFYEEFLNFQADCSFLCEAITSIANEEELLGLETALGITRFSHTVKNRTQELKQTLHKLYQQAYTLEHSLPPKDGHGCS